MERATAPMFNGLRGETRTTRSWSNSAGVDTARHSKPDAVPVVAGRETSEKTPKEVSWLGCSRRCAANPAARIELRHAGRDRKSPSELRGEPDDGNTSPDVNYYLGELC